MSTLFPEEVKNVIKQYPNSTYYVEGLVIPRNTVDDEVAEMMRPIYEFAAENNLVIEIDQDILGTKFRWLDAKPSVRFIREGH